MGLKRALEALEIYDRVHLEMDEGAEFSDIDNGLTDHAKNMTYNGWLGYMTGRILNELRDESVGG